MSQHLEELRRICQRFQVRRLELFGSAATGQDRRGHSDLDFVVEFAPLAPGTYFDTYFGLLEALIELYGRPVDLVEAETIVNPYFRASVDRTKVLVFAS